MIIKIIYTSLKDCIRNNEHYKTLINIFQTFNDWEVVDYNYINHSIFPNFEIINFTYNLNLFFKKISRIINYELLPDSNTGGNWKKLLDSKGLSIDLRNIDNKESVLYHICELIDEKGKITAKSRRKWLKSSIYRKNKIFRFFKKLKIKKIIVYMRQFKRIKFKTRKVKKISGIDRIILDYETEIKRHYLNNIYKKRYGDSIFDEQYDYQHLGELYMYKGFYYKGIECYYNSVFVSKLHADRVKIIDSLRNLGNEFRLINNFNIAIKIYERTIKYIFKTTGNLYEIANMYYLLAKLNLQLNNIQLALDYCQSANNTAEIVKYKKIIYNSKFLKENILKIEKYPKTEMKDDHFTEFNFNSYRIHRVLNALNYLQRYYLIKKSYKKLDLLTNKFNTLISKENIEYFITRILNYINFNEYKYAKEACNSALILDNNNNIFIFIMGYINFKLEKYKIALFYYNQFIKINLFVAEGYYNRGLVHLNLNDLENAIKDFTNSININSEYYLAYILRGLCYYQSKIFHLAFKDFSHSLKLNNHDSSFVYNCLGCVNFQLKEYNEAIKYLTMALSGYSRLEHRIVSGYIHYNRGIVYNKMNNYKKLIVDLNDVLISNSLANNSRRILADVYFQIGNFRKAIDCLDILIKHFPSNPYFFYKRGEANLNEGYYEKALNDYNEALSLDINIFDKYLYHKTNLPPTNSKRYDDYFEKYDLCKYLELDFNKSISYDQYLDEFLSHANPLILNDFEENEVELDTLFYLKRGICYFKLQKYSEALLDFERSTIYKNAINEVCFLQAITNFYLGNYSVSLKKCEYLIKKNIKHDYIIFLLALNNYEFENYPIAIKYLTEIISNNQYYKYYKKPFHFSKPKTDPINFIINAMNKIFETSYENIYYCHYYRALCYKKLKLFQNAIDDISIAIKRNVTFKEALENRALINIEINNLNEALIDYNNILKLWPSDINAYIERGKLYIKLNDIENAKNNFNNILSMEPDNISALIYLGEVNFLQNNFKCALLIYNKILKLKRNESYLFYNRAVICAKLKKYKKVIQNLNKAIKIDRNYFDAIIYRAEIFFQDGKYIDSFKDYLTILRIKPDIRNDILLKLIECKRLINNKK